MFVLFNTVLALILMLLEVILKYMYIAFKMAHIAFEMYIAFKLPYDLKSISYLANVCKFIKLQKR